jgi:hypothetical protein
MWPVKILIFLATAYLMVAAALFAMQTSLIFPARMVGAAGPLPRGADRLEIAAASGEPLHGIHIPPAAAAGSPRPALLAFAGNAWNAENAAAFLHELFPDRDVVAFHYRGYAPSGGSPSAAALLEDAPLIHDAVAATLGRRPIVAVGFSIGSGVAAHLAARRPLAGAILVTPFDSLGALAAGHHPWLPVRLLLRHRMEPAHDLAASRVPVAIIAGARDTLIPPPRTAALKKAVPNLVYDRAIQGAGHNDIYHHSAFAPAMAEAFRRIEGRR